MEQVTIKLAESIKKANIQGIIKNIIEYLVKNKDNISAAASHVSKHIANSVEKGIVGLAELTGAIKADPTIQQLLEVDQSGTLATILDTAAYGAHTQEVKSASLKKIAEGIKDHATISMSRDDISKKKFLVELQENLFDDLALSVKTSGVSRNMLMNLLIEYYLKNESTLAPKLLELNNE
jgi:hypothetical protein